MTILLAGQYALAITAILALIGMVGKWLIVNPLKVFIKEQTYPIHPNSNGGHSLPDAIATLNRIESRIGDIEERLVQVEDHVTRAPVRPKKPKAV